MYSSLIYVGTFLFSIATATVLYSAFKPNIKGWQGERKVNKVLKNLQKQGIGKSLKDITLITDEGLSSQIDNIFINKSGIFIIEAKNYSGVIIGTENSPKWIQKIGNKEYMIGNFARQNINHIKAVRPILSEYPSLPVYSFLSFNPNCEINLDLTRTIATRYNTLGNAIKIRSRLPIISDSEVNKIYKLLKAEKAKNILISKTHVSRLNLQQEADMHANNLNMSREEYNDMLVEKYKKNSTVLSDLNYKNVDSLDNKLNKASNHMHTDNLNKIHYSVPDRENTK